MAITKGTKILICGLPGSGKSTLARLMQPHLNAVVFNGDDLRTNINTELGFSIEDRILQARRIGWLCDQVTIAGHNAIADFVCPTEETRNAFGAAFTVWVDRIDESRFPDTNKLFEVPTKYDYRTKRDVTPDMWKNEIIKLLLD